MQSNGIILAKSFPECTWEHSSQLSNLLCIYIFRWQKKLHFSINVNVMLCREVLIFKQWSKSSRDKKFGELCRNLNAFKFNKNISDGLESIGSREKESEKQKSHGIVQYSSAKESNNSFHVTIKFSSRELLNDCYLHISRSLILSFLQTS